MTPKKLWYALAAVLVLSFGVLGFFGMEIFRTMPPFAQPERCELVRAADGNHYTLLLRSDRLLRDVYIDTGSPELQPEENFLDLLPQRQYRIRILPRAGTATPLPPTLPLKLKALNPQR